jgi:flavin-dependent dehydrogenase
MIKAPHYAAHLVIGGGPAGSLLALRLAAAGRRVTLIEKEREPHHKVCGEFLSPEAIGYLQQIGIDLLSLGAASIQTLRLSSGNIIVETPLPFEALSLSRCVLDEALLKRAEENGCFIFRGIAVNSLNSHNTGWGVWLSDGRFIPAGAVFLATGKHNLRGFDRSSARQSDLVGFKMHWKLPTAQIAALRSYMDLYLFPGGYGGLSLIENDIANMCLVVRRSSLHHLGAWPNILAAILSTNPQLQHLLGNAAPFWPRPLAISPIPYGYINRNTDNLWRLGDQAAVIPSFTGDGISIALHSAALAAQMFLSGKTADDYHRALRTQLQSSMTLATTLSKLAVTFAGRIATRAALPLLPTVVRSIARSTRIQRSSLVYKESIFRDVRSRTRQSA